LPVRRVCPARHSRSRPPKGGTTNGTTNAPAGSRRLDQGPRISRTTLKVVPLRLADRNVCPAGRQECLPSCQTGMSARLAGGAGDYSLAPMNSCLGTQPRGSWQPAATPAWAISAGGRAHGPSPCGRGARAKKPHSPAQGPAVQGQSGRDDPSLPLIEDLGFPADDRVDEPIHGRPLRW